VELDFRPIRWQFSRQYVESGLSRILMRDS
jgi:hypothetical protein